MSVIKYFLIWIIRLYVSGLILEICIFFLILLLKICYLNSFRLFVFCILDVDIIYIWIKFNLDMFCSKLYLVNGMCECFYSLKWFIIFWMVFIKRKCYLWFYMYFYNVVILKFGYGINREENKSFNW